MSKFAIGIPAPDFELPDLYGVQFRLSEHCHEQTILLVMNRGFF